MNKIYKLSQGCCSWHGGISYCGNNGYYICNDGTQSPSCRCSNEDSKKIIDNYQNDYSISSNECFYDSYETTIEELQEENQELKNTNNNLAFILALIIIIIIVAYIYKKNKEEK